MANKTIIVLALAVLLMLAGCDPHEAYNHAIVYSPGGEIVKEGEIKYYITTLNSVTVGFVDGIRCETSIENIILISDKDDEYYIIDTEQHNKNFMGYVDRMRRIHPDVSVEEVLSKKIVQGVAQYYQEREAEKK